MSKKDPIVIVATKRTPIGQYLGMLMPLTAPELGATAIKVTMKNTDLKENEIDEVIMGCVLPAGLGQAPARQSAIKAGLSNNVGATTINKMCGSGLKAIMMAHDAISAEEANIIIAGGMESMSNAPYLLKKARAGIRIGHDQIYDSMFLDGLEDAYEKGTLMGVYGEECAKKFDFSRSQQDEFAIESLTRAQNAIKNGSFKDEILKITIQNKKQSIELSEDELPGKAKIDKIPQLRPAFGAEGTITAANASAISDGACVHILMKESEAKKRGLKPLAKICAQSTHAHEPKWFTTAPIEAIKKVLEKSNWKTKDVDLFEINEAFAVVTMGAIKELELNPEKVNIHGGACALGHPIGASGARILTTLIYALKNQNKKRGVASLCIGGGEAVAMSIEVI
jgi:acetyl-CoA C-acetyltransferase